MSKDDAGSEKKMKGEGEADGEAEISKVDPPSQEETTEPNPTANLDVDPALVVHRFSKTATGDNQPGSGENEYEEYDDEEGFEMDDEEGEDYWRNSNQTGDSMNTEQMEQFFSQMMENLDGDDEDLEEMDFSNMDDEFEDTIYMSTEPTEATETIPLEDTEGKETAQGTSGKGEISKKAFRWFERRVLAQQIPQSDENLRRSRLLEKCQLLRKDSKPIVTILGAKSRGLNSSDSKTSTQEIGDSEAAAITFPEFSDKAWALKNTIDFLTTAGCTSSSNRSYNSRLKSAKEEAADFRLTLYERQLQRRREAIGDQMHAPEITAALRRHAERAMWRAVIDNTKPRYPLPRFILPRHQYLKKVQGQFIGPGSYEHDVFDKQVKGRQLRLSSTWSGCSSRFPKEKEPTGSASRLLDPWTTLDKANYKKKYPGIYIPFESSPNICRRQAVRGGSRLPPNAYNIKSHLEEFIKKRTSLRGPFDCYTPSRSIIPYGYRQSLNDEEKCRLGPGSYEIRPSLVKEMNDSYNFFKGKLGKADRSDIFGFKAAFDKPLWPRKGVIIPPPGAYDVGKDVIGADKKQNKEPFKTGANDKEFFTPELVAPDYF